MNTLRRGSLRLFQFAGVDVFLHWTWFLVAAIEIGQRGKSYSSPLWNVLEYLALFVIVTMHEFGHALACRQVGGTANRIVLSPLGGVAYVSPPPRPGATLWSIAAGPLVNVALLPVLSVLWFWAGVVGWDTGLPNAYALVKTVAIINIVLLVFNLLPIYPLDGGQILRSLLWFVVGRAKSLMATAIIGFVGVAGLFFAAALLRSAWLGVVSVFILLSCWSGLRQARALARLAEMPRRAGFACPACKSAPPVAPLWKCIRCGQAFDTFVTMAVCPRCAMSFSVTKCVDCGALNPMSAWLVPAVASPHL